MSESGFPILSFVYSLGHYLVVLLCSYFSMWTILQRGVSIIFSPHACFVVVSQLYFSASVLKYFRIDEHGFGFLGVTRTEQFLGFLIGQIVMILISFHICRQKNISINKLDGFLSDSKNQIAIFTLVVLVISIAIKIKLLSSGYGSTYTEAEFTKLRLRADQDTIWINTVEIVDQIAWVFSFLGLFSTRDNIHRSRRFLYGMIAVITFVTSVYLSRSRLAVGVFILTGLVVFQLLNPKRGVHYVFMLIVFAPFALLSMPMFSFVLGRENIVGESYAESIIQGGYRADLTDFAYLVAKKMEFVQVDLDLVGGGVVNAIPSLVLKSKKDFMIDHYAVNLERLGLISRNESGQELIDYQDSYFSSGVMCFGWVGFFIMPIIVLKIASLALKVLLRGQLAHDKIILSYPFGLMFLRIEVEYANIIINFRNAIQSFVIISVLWWSLKYIVNIKKANNRFNRDFRGSTN